MAREARPVVILRDNLIVALFPRADIFFDIMGYSRNTRRPPQKWQGKGYVYEVRFLDQLDTQSVIWQPKAWYCETHELYIAKGMECPLCIADKKVKIIIDWNKD